MSRLAPTLQAAARLYPHCGVAHDYRRRLTRKVIKMLGQGRHVVVVGGPRMGKSYLINQVREAGTAASTYDDVVPTMIPALLHRREATLVTTHIDFLESSRLLDERVFRVPLTTIVPKHLELGEAASWKQSLGHPSLAATQSAVARERELNHLMRAWRLHLKTNPQAHNVCGDLMRMDEHLSPVQRYQIIRQRYGCNTKRILDWLVCLGMVHRQKYTGGAAGIVPTFATRANI